MSSEKIKLLGLWTILKSIWFYEKCKEKLRSMIVKLKFHWDPARTDICLDVDQLRQRFEKGPLRTMINGLIGMMHIEDAETAILFVKTCGLFFLISGETPACTFLLSFYACKKWFEICVEVVLPQWCWDPF